VQEDVENSPDARGQGHHLRLVSPARALITGLDTDADNVYVTLSS
jgi:hypothetical protein